MHASSDLARQTRGRTLDHAAGLYDLLSPLASFGHERRIQRQVIDLLQMEAECRVLDVGCATGAFSQRLAQACPDMTRSEVVGIDAAGKMIDVARARHGEQPNLRFEAALAENLPFENEVFHRAVSSFFFHHVDADLKHRCLQEIYRTLRPDGVLVVVDVDCPTTWLGRISAWSGFLLFQQNEIRENIRGGLREALDASPFRRWRQESHHCGYISVFKLWK